MRNTETDIALHIRAAIEKLQYSLVLRDYPKKNGKKNYKLGEVKDDFCKRICNAFFYESLLISCTLLSRNKKEKSLSSLSIFKEDELEELRERYKQMWEIRDQVIAHIDIKNSNNTNSDSRVRGIIDGKRIEELNLMLKEVVDLFLDNCTEKYNSTYFFDNIFENDMLEFLKAVKPELTDEIII